MAFSLSITSKKVYGNDQVIHGVLSADGAAGAVATGLVILDMAHVTPKSAATGNATDTRTARRMVTRRIGQRLFADQEDHQAVEQGGAQD